jgi:hypothetical protein
MHILQNTFAIRRRHYSEILLHAVQFHASGASATESALPAARFPSRSANDVQVIGDFVGLDANQ